MAKRKNTNRQTMIYVANYISSNANRQTTAFYMSLVFILYTYRQSIIPDPVV